MKVTFFYSLYEYLGIAYMSAVLKKSGFLVDRVFSKQDRAAKTSLGKALYKSEEMYCDEILATNPDLIAFSSMSDTYSRELNLARIIKRKAPSKPIIFGGVHPTSVPECVISESAVDYVCVGEGEEAILDLVTAMRDKKSTTDIPNIWAKKEGKIFRNDVRPLIKDLDALPFYDKELFAGNNVMQLFGKFYGVIAGRGCYNRCTYCYNSLWRDIYKNASPKYVRHRSVDDVISELIYAKEKYKANYIYFHDDIFFYGHDWMDDFLAKYEKYINLPLHCNLYVSFVTDELVKKIKSAANGDCTIVIAAESMNYDTRKNIFDRKETNETIIKAHNILRQNQVLISNDIIINLPIEDENKQLIETAVFFNEYKMDSLKIFSLRYYPNLKITQKAFEKGILSEEDMNKINQGIDCNNIAAAKKVNNNLVILLLVAGLLPKRVLVFCLEKMAKRKDSKIFIISMAFYYLLVSIKKQIFNPRKGNLILLFFSAFIDNILYLLRKSPKNIIAHIRKSKSL